MAGGARWFSSNLLVLVIGVVAVLLYLAELPRASIVLGLWRQPAKTIVTDPHDFHLIPDTVHCEDLHYHEPSNLLFTACEGTEHTRQAWFPALAVLGDPTTGLKAQGALEVIDPRVSVLVRMDQNRVRGKRPIFKERGKKTKKKKEQQQIYKTWATPASGLYHQN